MIFSIFTLPTQNNTAVIYKYCNQLISQILLLVIAEENFTIFR